MPPRATTSTRTKYHRDYSRARVVAIRQLIEAHPEEFKKLLTVERTRQAAESKTGRTTQTEMSV